MLVVIAWPWQSVSDQTRTVASPFFSTSDGAGFVVDCRNSGSVAIEFPQSSEVRVDGVPQKPLMNFQGGWFPKAPGASWNELITLHAQHPSQVRSLGFNVHRQLTLDLTPGRHTIAFACGEGWSDEIPFYWNSLPH